MNTPIPPTIPSSGNFAFVQTNIISKNIGKEFVQNEVIANGYTTTYGAYNVIDGQDQTYTAAQVCGGMIERTGTTVSVSTDTLPSAAEIAAELGLPDTDSSFVRMLGIYNPTSYNILLQGDNWTFIGSDLVRGEQAYTFMLNIVYSSGTWSITCMIVGEIDLD